MLIYVMGEKYLGKTKGVNSISEVELKFIYSEKKATLELQTHNNHSQLKTRDNGTTRLQ
uniref:Uncharacterized protein n=1 Tax=Ciona savignyi TaxID=51511 RepID=H2Z1E0_CIOSA